MKQSTLSQALKVAQAGNPLVDEIARGRQQLRSLAQHAVNLVDADRLGCIIVVELANAEGTQVKMTPAGDPRLIRQAVLKLAQQAGINLPAEPRAHESDASQVQPAGGP